MEKTDLMSEQPTPSKSSGQSQAYAGLGASVTAEQLQEENKVTANKMAEKVQQVTMKDPKKVDAGKRLAECNRRKREEGAQLAKSQSESNLTYYSAGAVIAVGVLGVISYYIY